MLSLINKGNPLFCTINWSLFLTICAPHCNAILIAVCVSSEFKKFVKTDCPSHKVANNNARILCDLEPGMVACPFKKCVLWIMKFNYALTVFSHTPTLTLTPSVIKNIRPYFKHFNKIFACIRFLQLIIRFNITLGNIF